MSNLRHVTTARVRAAYTGERHQWALEEVRAYRATHSVVPDAQREPQRLLEALVLDGLARSAGRWNPAGAGTLYGVAVARPNPAGLRLRLEAVEGWHPAVALLPRVSGGEQVDGVPGLRATVRGKRVVLRHLELAGASIEVEHADGWPAAITGLAQEQGSEGRLWESDGLAEAERAAYEQRRARLEPQAPAWSRALRRPALYRGRAEVDFTAAAPDLVELEGPVPDRLLPRTPARLPSPTTIAFVSHRGRSLGTTTVFHIATNLALFGHRVLAIDATLTEDLITMAGRAARTDGGEVAVFPHTLAGGSLTVTGLPVEQAMAGPGAGVDYIVIDACGMSDQGEAAASLADLTVLPCPMPKIPSSYTVITAAGVAYEWLSDRFKEWDDARFEAALDDDASQPGEEGEEDLTAAEEHEQFLEAIAARAVEELGAEAWEQHHAGWAAQHAADSAPDELDRPEGPELFERREITTVEELHQLLGAKTLRPAYVRAADAVVLFTGVRYGVGGDRRAMAADALALEGLSLADAQIHHRAEVARQYGALIGVDDPNSGVAVMYRQAALELVHRTRA